MSGISLMLSVHMNGSDHHLLFYSLQACVSQCFSSHSWNNKQDFVLNVLTHKYASTHAHVHTHTNTHMHAYMCTHTQTNTCTDTYVHAHAHTHMHAHTEAHTLWQRQSNFQNVRFHNWYIQFNVRCSSFLPTSWITNTPPPPPQWYIPGRWEQPV